jgi:hypothetical protein
MPLYQHGKRLFGGLIAAGDEPVKQLAIAQVARNAKAEERSQVSEGFFRRPAGHETFPEAALTSAV